jgi:hypothetical protein
VDSLLGVMGSSSLVPESSEVLRDTRPRMPTINLIKY